MSDQDRFEGVYSVAEMLERDEHAAHQRILKVVVGLLIGLGLIFTGTLNFLLYSRAFTGGLMILGIVPAILIEGSLATFLLGNLVWFAHGIQGSLAKVFGWLMFLIVAANSVIEFNARLGSGGVADDFLRLYSFWGVPIVIPLVIGFWKAVIDAEPSVQVMRQRRRIAQALQIAKLDSTAAALGNEDSRKALLIYGQRSADDINRKLTSGDGLIRPPNGHKSETIVLNSTGTEFASADKTESDPIDEAMDRDGGAVHELVVGLLKEFNKSRATGPRKNGASPKA